jgi:hypothetical protein
MVESASEAAWSGDPSEGEEGGDAVATATPRSPGPSPEPRAPAGVSSGDRQRLEARAAALLERLLATEGDFQLARSLGALGAAAQQQAQQACGRVRGRLESLDRRLDGPGSHLAQGLAELGAMVARIDPHLLSTRPRGLLNRLLRRPPTTLEALQDLAAHCDAAQIRFDGLVDALRMGRDAVLEDDLAAGRLQPRLPEARLELEKDAYLGELLWRGLETRVDAADGEAEAPADESERREELHAVIERVATRVGQLRRDAREVDALFEHGERQARADDAFDDGIVRVLGAARAFLTAGLALPETLSKDEADPGLLLDDLKQAFGELADALDRADALREVAIRVVREALESSRS